MTQFELPIGETETSEALLSGHNMAAADAAGIELPMSVIERFHDCIVHYSNSIQVGSPDEERLRDAYFNGLLDALETERLGDPRRAMKKREGKKK